MPKGQSNPLFFALVNIVSKAPWNLSRVPICLGIVRSCLTLLHTKEWKKNTRSFGFLVLWMERAGKRIVEEQLCDRLGGDQRGGKGEAVENCG